MIHYCVNHTQKKALSFCIICKNYYCEECLSEGKENYFCKNKDCYSHYLKELESYDYNPRFCPKCVEETISDSAGDVDTLNFIGTVLYNMGKDCPVCHSTIAKKCYTIFGVNTKEYGYYRVIYLKKYTGWFERGSTFISRALKNPEDSPYDYECSECGTDVPDNAKVCPKCGAILDEKV